MCTILVIKGRGYRISDMEQKLIIKTKLAKLPSWDLFNVQLQIFITYFTLEMCASQSQGHS